MKIMEIKRPEPSELPHVSICICTFRREKLLRRLLEQILKLQGVGVVFQWTCVVVDNDSDGTAESVVSSFAERRENSFIYQIEKTRSFPIVRNKSLSLAKGDYIAFIDDDEYPEESWIVNMLKTLREYPADGVLGPVRPYFETTPPSWLVASGLCDRPVHPTGMLMPWQKSRTGNFLLSGPWLRQVTCRLIRIFRLVAKMSRFFVLPRRQVTALCGVRKLQHMNWSRWSD